MIRLIAHELKEHAPFTALGAVTGIIIMVIVVLGSIPSHISQTAFLVAHPGHVLLSALVTTAMYARYKKSKVWAVILIGWTGSIGVATVSDAIIPYLGGSLLNAQMEFHVPFIEEWWINLVALAGIAIGYWKQTTKIPHFGHVLLSTWASLFYFTAFGIFQCVDIDFFAVWCCSELFHFYDSFSQDFCRHFLTAAA